MLVTLELLRCAVGAASEAYRRFVPARPGDRARLEWCCGCVTTAQCVAGTTVWIDETRCPQHENVPFQTALPPVGGSNALSG